MFDNFTTGNGIFDKVVSGYIVKVLTSIISSILIFLKGFKSYHYFIFAILVVVLLYCLFDYKNEIENSITSHFLVLIIGIEFGLVLVLLLNPFRELEKSRNIELCNKHIIDFCEDLKDSPTEVKPLISYIAYVSAHNLISNKISKGEYIRLEEYMRLLTISLQHEDLEDVTFVALTKPSDWFSRGNDLAKLAEGYLNEQKNQADKQKKLRIRRFLIISENDWNTDSQYAKERFTKVHQDANIDLFFYPNDLLTKANRDMVQDMAIYFSSQNKCWCIQTDFEEKRLSSGVVNAYIDINPSSIKNLCGTLLSVIFKLYLEDYKNDNTWKPHILSTFKRNSPPDEFLKKNQISL